MNQHQCPFCGKLVPATVTRCPSCQTELPVLRQRVHYASEASRRLLRRGILWMLLAGVLYYFAAGYGAFEFPVAVAPMLTDWVLPLLFLAGLGLALYGAYGRLRG
jgi:hypothetical protein